MDERTSPWLECAATLLNAGQLVQPSGVTEAVNGAVAAIGAGMTVFLVDREQRSLRPLSSAGIRPEPVSVDGSLGGRAFMTITPVPSPSDDRQLWMPIVDGTERLGVAHVRLPENMSARDPLVLDGVRVFAIVVANVLVTKLAYGDSLRRVRRSQPMSVGGELLWHMLPPLTFGTTNLALAAVIEPCYRVGGDAFDYAVDHDVAHVGIFDAVGHDLNASITTTLTLAATRAARIRGDGLLAVARAADQALASQFEDLRYSTAVLAQLDIRQGRLRYITAGHPATVLIRRGRAVIVLDGARRTPLGIADVRAEVAEESLEPGDRLLFHTDGISDARGADGEPFGTDRLVDLAERLASAGLPAPETARRIVRAVIEYQEGALHDDATLMIVEWGPQAGHAVTP